MQNNENMTSNESMQSYKAPAGRKYYFSIKDTCTFSNHDVKFAYSSVSNINLLGTYTAVTLECFYL